MNKGKHKNINFVVKPVRRERVIVSCDIFVPLIIIITRMRISELMKPSYTNPVAKYSNGKFYTKLKTKMYECFFFQNVSENIEN